MTAKELEKKLEEQRRLGYPNFKNKIVNILVKQYQVDLFTAKRTVFHSIVNEKIDEDIFWAQHMGPEFWAEVIIENQLHRKEDEETGIK